MCRMFAFRSSVLSHVHASLLAAENALAIQSLEHPDGWGVSYYNSRFPHLIRSEKQALADGLFRELSGVVATRTLLAHIRQATTGKVSVLNCHPFQHGPWSFAHNGQVAEFEQGSDIQRQLTEAVDPRFRNHILGTTDSEVCFYLFLSRLGRRVEDIYHHGIPGDVVRDALQEMTDVVMERAPEPNPDEPNRLCFLVTNGSVMLASRFRRTLHFSTYKSECPESSTCDSYEPNRCEQEVSDGLVKHLIVSSEEVQGPNVWIEMVDGDAVYVDQGMNLRRAKFPALSDTPVTRLPIVA
jgi:predicted glutamine amidotransferase